MKPQHTVKMTGGRTPQGQQNNNSSKKKKSSAPLASASSSSNKKHPQQQQPTSHHQNKKTTKQLSVKKKTNPGQHSHRSLHQTQGNHEEDDDDNDDDPSDFPIAAPRGGFTMDMIASSATRGASSNASKVVAEQRRKRKRDAKEDDEEEDEEENEDDGEENDDDDEEMKDGGDENEEEDINTTKSFPAAAPSTTIVASSSASAPSTSSSSSTTSAPLFAPAATGTGALFSSLTPPLDSDLLHVLTSHFGFTRMTPVQQQTIPTMLRRDVAVQSYTGSGKTLSFVLPMMQILLNKLTHPTTGELTVETHSIYAIVLSPTRELAKQICHVIEPFVNGGKYASERLKKFRLIEFIGGTNMTHLESTFVQYGGNIIVGTPGRLNSSLGKLIQMNLKDLRVLILDEADRLLEEGFEQDLTDILRKIPKQRRTGLFSATQTRQVKELKRAGLQEKYASIDVLLEWKKKKDESSEEKKSLHVDDEPTRTQMTPTTLSNYYTLVSSSNKFSLLLHFLQTHSHEKIIVFFLTGDQVEYVARVLPKMQGIVARGMQKKIFSLRGGMKGMIQTKRFNQLDSFIKESDGGILLATDVASRGIDVPDVDWIIQYDPPKDSSVFVHRIGRTARAGKVGKAIVYLTPEETPYINLIHNLNVPISELPVPVSAFEQHHSWKTDAVETEKIVKGMQEGKMQALHEAMKKKVPVGKSQGEETSSSSSSTATSSTTSSTSYPPSSIRSCVRELRLLSLDDRLLMERGQKAYTSYIDGYKQHLLTHALNYTRLQFDSIALGIGLLYLPKMPDMKHLMKMFRYERCPVAASYIRFKDMKLQAAYEEKEKIVHEKNQSEQAARETKWKEKQKALAAAGPKRKKKQSQLMREEWEELQNENRLLKQLKKGKISKKEFEEAVGERKKGKGKDGDDGSDDDDGSNLSGDDDDDAAPVHPKKKAKTGKAAHDEESDADMSDDE